MIRDRQKELYYYLVWGNEANSASASNHCLGKTLVCILAYAHPLRTGAILSTKHDQLYQKNRINRSFYLP